MIRPFTCVCLLLACGSGLYLYQTKHRAQLLEREIARTQKQTEAARARSDVLQAEWALLNDPQRLQELAAKFLALATVQPHQFVALADLGQRLPEPGALARPGAVPDPAGADAADPEADAPPMPGLPASTAASPAASPAAAVAAGPAIDAPATAPMPVRPPPPAAAARVADGPPVPAALLPRPDRAAAASPRRHDVGVAPAPRAAPVAIAQAAAAPQVSAPLAAPARLRQTGPVSPAPVAARMLGSALGGLRAALAPPVPIDVSQALR